MKLIVKTFHGLENVLAKELKSIGAKDIEILIRAVSCNGDKELLYKSNLLLRTALRVLQPIHTFTAHNDRHLYKKTGAIDWSTYLQLDQTFAIDSVAFSDRFRHSKYVALRVKDAIADQFREKTGKRPSVDTENPDVRINVHVAQTDFSISLDSSGDSLHKRGYREKGMQAPLNETLAAGMLMLAEWNKNIPLIDPMCGSGTIPIEAAMIACNIPPGINRKMYGFMNWGDYDAALWKKIYDESISQIKKETVNITGKDIDSRVVDIAKAACKKMDIQQQLSFSNCTFTDLLPQTESGILIMNPPYGERMGADKVNALYKMIGDHLKQSFSGFDAWILSSNTEALKHVGLRASKKNILFNGPLECKFQRFSLYKGSLKSKKNVQQ